MKNKAQNLTTFIVYHRNQWESDFYYNLTVSLAERWQRFCSPVAHRYISVCRNNIGQALLIRFCF